MPSTPMGVPRLIRFNDPFVKWVVRVATILYLIVRIPVVLHVIAKLPWLQLFHRLPNMYVAADGLQVVVMALLLGPCWVVRTNIAELGGGARQIAIIASDQFKSFWVWLIATWLFFYLLLFLRPFVGNQRVIWDGGIDCLNNIQGVLLFLCYWSLTTITVDETEVPKKRSFPYALLCVAIALFFIADMASPGDQTTRMIFRLLSGLWVGVSMGLLVGCLESEYLHVISGRYPTSRRVAIGSLYLYAVLQVAFVGFGFQYGASLRPDLMLVENFASILSLPLKLLFISLCYWLLREGRLEFYMQKTRKTIQTADADWAEFQGESREATAVLLRKKP